MTAMAPTVTSSPVRSADPFFPVDAAGTTAQFARRVRMPPGPGAAAIARAEVAAAISAWGIDVDPDVALLLTSELVTNAVTHGVAVRDPRDPSTDPGETAAQVTLAITADGAGLRVDVHDGSADPPVLEMPVLDPPVLDPPVLEMPVLEMPVLEMPVLEMPVLEMPALEMPALEVAGAEQESGRGLLLVTSLSTEWGFYPTPGGKAVYFTLDVKPG